MSVFSRAEIEERQETFREGVSSHDVELAFIHTADNVLYLTGAPLLSEWGRPMWAVLSSSGEASLIGCLMEQENMAKEAVATEILAYGDEENVWPAALEMVKSVAQKLRGREPLRVGIERPYMSVQILDGLTRSLPNAQFFDISDVLAEMRVIKSREEIALLELAGRVAQTGAKAFRAALRPGASELEVASAAVGEMNRAQADLLSEAASSSYAYCHAGDHTLSPHMHPTGRRIGAEDVIGLNVFPVIAGYCIELERTLLLGGGTNDQVRALDVVTGAFHEVKERLRPGALMSDIDSLAQGILKREGYGASIRHGTGHALGVMIGAASREELGELRSYNRRPLQPGMICSVEPAVYVPELGGFRHSDVMLITETGAECLTEFPT